MKKIFYFSGTGNTLSIAKELSQKIDAEIVPIALLMYNDSIEIDADTIGIIFPVYYADLPIIIKSFVKKLKGIEDKYIFAVCNYGGAASNSLTSLSKLIRLQGGELSSAYGINMTQNAFSKPFENPRKIFAKASKRISFIADKVLNKKIGIYYSNKLIESILTLFYKYIRKKSKEFLLQITSSPDDYDIDTLIHLVGKTFKTNENCNVCGICVKTCPVNNIKIADNKPVWYDHCENCLACYNWCPKKAIRTELLVKDYYYRNPNIKINDIINQSEPLNT